MITVWGKTELKCENERGRNEKLKAPRKDKPGGKGRVNIKQA